MSLVSTNTGSASLAVFVLFDIHKRVKAMLLLHIQSRIQMLEVWGLKFGGRKAIGFVGKSSGLFPCSKA
jgi:hypothetical protein